MDKWKPAKNVVEARKRLSDAGYQVTQDHSSGPKRFRMHTLVIFGCGTFTSATARTNYNHALKQLHV